MVFTKARTKREAIVTAVEEFNRRWRMADLVKHAGTCDGFVSADQVKSLRRKGSTLILVDTSAWIHFLRPKGNEEVRKRIASALTDGEACWCPMIRLEPWNGAQGQKESAVFRDLERGIAEPTIDDDVWAGWRCDRDYDPDLDMLNSLRIRP